MGDEVPQTGVARNRLVLGDVTNSCTKRGFSLVSGKLLIENDTIRKQEPVEGGIEDGGSRKRMFGGLEDTSEGEDGFSIVFASSRSLEVGCVKKSSLPKSRKINEAMILGYNSEPAEVTMDSDVRTCAKRMEKFVGSLEHEHSNLGNPFPHVLPRGKGEAELRESCVTGASLPLQLGIARDYLLMTENGDHGHSEKDSRYTRSNIVQTDATARQKWKLQADMISKCRNSDIEFVDPKEKLAQTSKCLPVEQLDRHSGQQNMGAIGTSGYKIVNLDELEKVQRDYKHGINIEESLVAGKNCSCSFCLKAAYLWTDLLYQDSKDRISEINRSRREAKFMAGRSYTCGLIGRSVGNHKKFTRVESDLMHRWRTLFLHTENVLMYENAQLQSNVLKLKELRESCKRDVEMINRLPSSDS